MIVAFDAMGTLFDLGDLEERMPPVLHGATSLTLAGEWAPFDEVAQAADPELAERLQAIEPYDDARRALEAVDEAWILTNGTREATETLLERSGLRELVAEVHTAEEVRRYKPHPDVYALLPEGAALVAAHAWDVVGARGAGYDAAWVARDPWPLPAPEPELKGSDLYSTVTVLARLRG